MLSGVGAGNSWGDGSVALRADRAERFDLVMVNCGMGLVCSLPRNGRDLENVGFHRTVGMSSVLALATALLLEGDM